MPSPICTKCGGPNPGRKKTGWCRACVSVYNKAYRNGERSTKQKPSTPPGICPRCKQPGEFWRVRKDCKACQRKRLAAWFERNPEKRRKYAHKTKDYAKISNRRKDLRRTDPTYREREIASNRVCQLRRQYGITEETYLRMYEEQHGLCLICEKPETRVRLNRLTRLVVDHNHKTKYVRGLLCSLCNKGLGMFFDDEERLRSAIIYLTREPYTRLTTPRLSKTRRDHHHLKNAYGITEDDYNRMAQEQNNLCAICRRAESSSRKGIPIRLAVDHRHGTKVVRGLLCSKCNQGVGAFRDSQHCFERAIDYLRREADHATKSIDLPNLTSRSKLFEPGSVVSNATHLPGLISPVA